MILFKDLPEKVQEAMLDEQVRQGNKRDEEVFIALTRRDRKRGGFDWSAFVNPGVKYPVDFWRDIILHGDYSEFYKVFTNKPTTIKIGEDVFNI